LGIKAKSRKSILVYPKNKRGGKNKVKGGRNLGL